ncbi:hypothetical protein NQ314_017902 [Rhamnusium bicolor]|uniref:beta-N-acetylhexosaminidase n=1 Tax=Rhamnusium bicolor TaxID=1586634 RepID=A0AAV8WS68_9CUCU|nr:hypothetical protein NQ314_017902 [Rhamnusium bicolor]
MSSRGLWSWNCERGFCQKKLITNETKDTALSLSACRLLCSESAALWPKPTGDVSVGNNLEKININSIDFEGIKSDTPIFDLTRGATKIFKEEIQSLVPKNINPVGGKSLIINLDIRHTNISKITLSVDESYILKVSESSDGRLKVLITAPTFFGARHGLQTLSQLVIYDDLRDELRTPRDVLISDRAAYPYRGILLDTSRNYITVDAIKKTLKGMGASKLNTFHWHITDSHSFPYVSKSQPDLSKYGAYSPSKMYSQGDIAEIIKYGNERGIRVLPEFDAPAHVGEGWQNTDLVTCLNWQPWQNYCVEPPCGQFDPTKSALYNVIEDYLPKDKYIIQIWTKGDDEQVTNLLANGYRLILSNYDALYFDCGFAGWVTDGNNWCSPYIGNKKNQILGGEATLWTEQVDSTSVDGRLWPRAAALAEVLWSEPENGWQKAEERFFGS